MIDTSTLSVQRVYIVNSIQRTLNKLPLSYMGNMIFHSIIKRHPLETLLLGYGLKNEDYNKRIKNFIKEALQTSPYLNN